MGNCRMMLRLSALVCLVVVLTYSSAESINPAEDEVVPEVEELQGNVLPGRAIGYHNSYHVKPNPHILGVMGKVPPLAGIAKDIAYSHPSTETQVKEGMTTFELDLFYDPKGGQYAHPFVSIKQVMGEIGKQLMGKPLPAIAPPLGKVPGASYYEAMLKPGFKVMHIQDIDYISNCGPTLGSCLEEIKTTRTNDETVVLIEIKHQKPKVGNMPIPFAPMGADMAPVDGKLWKALEAKLKPYTEQGFKFLLDNDDLSKGYVKWRMNRSGKPVLSANVSKMKGNRARKLKRSRKWRNSVWLKCSDPTRNCKFGKPIYKLVGAGWLVRTRADADVAGFNKQRALDALKSNAQIVHSDYAKGVAELLKSMSQADCETCTDGFFMNNHGHTCAELRKYSKGGQPDWIGAHGEKAGDVCLQFACKVSCK